MEAGYEFKYNKYYIGLVKDRIAKNFISFKPKKSFLYLLIKTNEDAELTQKLEDAGLDISYDSRWNNYRIKLANHAEYKKHEELIKLGVSAARDHFNISEA